MGVVSMRIHVIESDQERELDVDEGASVYHSVLDQLGPFIGKRATVTIQGDVVDHTTSFKDFGLEEDARVGLHVVSSTPCFEGPVPRNCQISGDMNRTVTCTGGSTGQWEACLGSAAEPEDGDFLEFAVLLEKLNGQGVSNNLCVGVAPADLTPNTGAGNLNTNACSLAFGTTVHFNDETTRICGERWSEGQVLSVKASGSTIEFSLDGVLVGSFDHGGMQGPLRPVVYMWYQGDTATFVDMD